MRQCDRYSVNIIDVLNASQARAVGQEWGRGVLLPKMWIKIRHEFQLYDVTDTLRRRLDSACLDYVLTFFLFEFWDFLKIGT